MAQTSNKEKQKTAVAIAYQPGEAAPKILATGKGAIADKIIEEAKKADVPLYKDDKLVQIDNYVTSENLKIDYDSKTEYTEITLKDKTKVNTPILKDIIGSNYEIKTKRTIYEE